jgi:hypothetical protein
VRHYIGERDRSGTCHVRIEGDGPTRPLPLRLDLFNHSPTGFEWGYGGSGPAQLALALLADAINDETALRLHQQFKFAQVAQWKRDARWHLSQIAVIAYVLRKETR